MDKISSLQSLSDYGLGDSDIEDSDEEKDESSIVRLAPVNSAPAVHSAPRVVSTSSRLVSYGEEDDDELAASRNTLGPILVEDITNSPKLVLNMTDENTEQENEDIENSEKPVEESSEIPSLRILKANVVLPPEPSGRCSMSLQDKIKTFLEKKQNGMDLNWTIQRRKDFRNPSIYEKLVSFLKIQENGTNYPPSLFDPDAWANGPNYEALAKLQKEAYEKKEKEKAKRTQIEFLSGTKKTSISTVPTNAADDTKKRKSKWDISAPPTVLPPAQIATKSDQPATKKPKQ